MMKRLVPASVARVPGDEGRPPEYDDWEEELCDLTGVSFTLGGALPKKPAAKNVIGHNASEGAYSAVTTQRHNFTASEASCAALW